MSGELTMVAMLAITAGTSVYVAWPLLMGKTRPEEFLGRESEETAVQQLMLQRDSTYAAMKELEFDLAVGNLSQEDFQQLYDRYKRKAVAILKRIDDVTAGRPSPKQILADIEDEPTWTRDATRPARASSGNVELDVEQEIEAFRTRSRGRASAPGAGVAHCPSCGHLVADEEAAFCARCGASLQGGAPQGPSAQRRESQKEPRGRRRHQ